ncbi:hypothetical protein MMC15_007048 [Xylographa vitiligo]|nr:hypothetical protein [Xylographa vitiligo]
MAAASSRIELDEVFLRTAPGIDIESHMNALRDRFRKLHLASNEDVRANRSHQYKHQFPSARHISPSREPLTSPSSSLGASSLDEDTSSWEAHQRTPLPYRPLGSCKEKPRSRSLPSATQSPRPSKIGIGVNMARQLDWWLSNRPPIGKAMLNGHGYGRVFEALNWLWLSNAGTPKLCSLSEYGFFGRAFSMGLAKSNGLDSPE